MSFPLVSVSSLVTWPEWPVLLVASEPSCPVGCLHCGSGALGDLWGSGCQCGFLDCSGVLGAGVASVRAGASARVVSTDMGCGDEKSGSCWGCVGSKEV